MCSFGVNLFVCVCTSILDIGFAWHACVLLSRHRRRGRLTSASRYSWHRLRISSTNPLNPNYLNSAELPNPTYLNPRRAAEPTWHRLRIILISISLHLIFIEFHGMSEESEDFLMFCWFPENAISIFRIIEIKLILARLPSILTSASH